MAILNEIELLSVQFSHSDDPTGCCSWPEPSRESVRPVRRCPEWECWPIGTLMIR